MTESKKSKDVYTIRDVTHDSIVTVHGRGQTYLIGLGVDGNLRVVPTQETTAPGVCVTLLQLTIADNGGMVLAPINLDLMCTINGEDLAGEINLISGVPIEVADRTLRIYQGGVPGRKLPLTPGLAVKASPPPKPGRDQEPATKVGTIPVYLELRAIKKPESKDDSLETPPHGERSHLPPIDPELLTDIKSTDKLANLAGSFLTKQINQYTDTKLSAAITDQIFTFLQEVAGYQRAIIVAYILEISQSLEEMPESERDRPLHKPSVRLLVELLRQIMDPLSHVVLCLQLLRTFSHFPDNLVVMVNCQATPAVLGCMAVYPEIPLRETALEMILRSIQHHKKSVLIVPPGCRTLVNLTSNLGSFPEVEEAIEKYDNLLRHIFQHAIPVVQSVLQEYPSNLDVKTEGRRFFYNYSRMTQFTNKKKLRVDFGSAITEPAHSFTETLTTPTMFVSNQNQDEVTQGILRDPKQKKYTDMLDRKVHFPDDVGPLDSLTSSEDESDPDLVTPVVEPKLVVKETVVLSEDAAEALRRRVDAEEEEERDPQFSVGVPQDENDPPDPLTDRGAGDRFTSEMVINLGPQGDIEDVTAKCGGTSITIETNPSPTSPVSIFCPTLSCNGHVRNSDPICQEEGHNTHMVRHNPRDMLYEDCDSVKKVKNVNSNQEPVQLNHGNDKSEGCEDCGGSAQGSKVKDTQPKTSPHSAKPHVLSSLSEDDEEEEDYIPMNFPQMDLKGGPVGEEAVRLRKDHLTPDTEELRYSVSDVSLCTKVSHYISSLVFGGEDAQALSVIDKPLYTLLATSEAPKGLLNYTKSQFEDSKTLMDIDTASLFHDLVQKSVVEVMNCMFGRYSRDVLRFTVICLMSLFENERLRSLLAERTFLTEVMEIMTKLCSALQKDIPTIQELQRLMRIIFCKNGAMAVQPS
uniref:Uncharacterized protein n=1 Tax=Magallana gigas TaxID=29159 RepID=K1RU29_MAGGI